MNTSKNGALLVISVATISLAGSVGCRRNEDGDSRSNPAPSASAWKGPKTYSEAEVVTLKAPVTPTSLHYGAMVIADKYGFYRAKGIKLQYVELPAGPGPSIEALKAGTIDIFTGGTGHPDGFIDALLAGVKVKAVVASTKGHPNFPHDTAWVPIDSPIKEPRDVIGKRVGGLLTAGWTQGCGAFYWSQYFKKNNISPDQVVNAVVPLREEEKALQQGLIDIITVEPPLTGVIAKSGKYRQLWSSWDITAGDVIEKQDADISVSGFTEDFIQKNPDVVKRYVRATIEALAFTVDNHEVYVDWVQKKTGWKTKDRDGGDHQDLSTGLVRSNALQKWIDWKVETGQLKAGQIKPSELFTNEFNPYRVYAMNDPVKNPTYWDNLPKEFLYLPVKK